MLMDSERERVAGREGERRFKRGSFGAFNRLRSFLSFFFLLGLAQAAGFFQK
jgi:hypothetical protein